MIQWSCQSWISTVSELWLYQFSDLSGLTSNHKSSHALSQVLHKSWRRLDKVWAQILAKTWQVMGESWTIRAKSWAIFGQYLPNLVEVGSTLWWDNQIWRVTYLFSKVKSLREETLVIFIIENKEAGWCALAHNVPTLHFVYKQNSIFCL